MYFTMNAAFVNYLDQFTNMRVSLKISNKKQNYFWTDLTSITKGI